MQDKQKYSRYESAIKKEAETTMPQSRCQLCLKPIKSTAKSHSIPHMYLQSIKQECDGHLYSFKDISQHILDNSNDKKANGGPANAGVFRYICDDCEHKYFSSYEQENSFTKEIPSQKLLYSIALKSALWLTYDTNTCFKRQTIIYNKYNNEIPLLQKQLFEDSKLNANDVKVLLDKIINDNDNLNHFPNIMPNSFKLILYHQLPYVTPIAVQDAVVIPYSLENTKLFDTTNPNIDLPFIYICIFPNKTLNQTTLLAFYYYKDKEYRQLLHQFNSLNITSKINYLNFWIFKYCHNYYCSKQTYEMIINNKNLVNLIMDETYTLDSFNLRQYQRSSILSPSEIPNLLSEKYAIT